jgi:hypothetical protein
VTVSSRAAIGSIAGSSAPRADNRPNMRGALTIEQDLPAGSKLWLAGWSKQIAGAAWISISGEIACWRPEEEADRYGDRVMIREAKNQPERVVS